MPSYRVWREIIVTADDPIEAAETANIKFLQQDRKTYKVNNITDINTQPYEVEI